MNAEQLKRANEIQDEIKKLNEFFGPLIKTLNQVDIYKKEKDSVLSLSILRYDNYFGGWKSGKDYFSMNMKGPMAEIFIEQLEEDIDFAANRLSLAIEKRIKQLQKEFDSL